MKHSIELSPSGGLRLYTPTGRTLDLEANTASVALLRKILYHAEVHEHKPMAYPTQAILDAWARGRAIDWSRPEPSVLRTVIEEALAQVRKAKPSLKIKHAAKIDLSKVEFEI